MNFFFFWQGRELKDDERTSITSGEGVSCLLLQDITADDSGKYGVCVENVYGADCQYASVSVEGKWQKNVPKIISKKIVTL